MAKTPGTSRDKARKGKRSLGTDTTAGLPAPKRAAGKTPGKAGTAKPGKQTRTGKASAAMQSGTASKAAAASIGKSAGKSRKRSGEAGPDVVAMPVVIQARPADVAVALPETAVPRKAGKKPGKRASARRPPRQTFLVAATLSDGEGAASLGVYAAVTRTPAEALAAVRHLVGADSPVGLTGKLSGRMAKALGLKPGEVRRI